MGIQELQSRVRRDLARLKRLKEALSGTKPLPHRPPRLRQSR